MIRIDDHIRELETFIDVTMHQLMLSIQDFDPETNSQEQDLENSSQYSPINTRSHSSETCVQSDLTIDQHCNQSFNSINLITPNHTYNNLVGKSAYKENETHVVVNHRHDMLYKDGQYYMCEDDDHKMNQTRQPVLRSSDSRPLSKNIVLDDSQYNPTKNKRRLIRKSFSFNAYGRGGGGTQGKNDHKSDQNSAKWGSLLKTRKLSVILQGKPLQTDGIRDNLYGHSKPTLGGVPPFQWPRISALLKRLLKFGVLRHSDPQSRPLIRNEPFLTQKQSNIRNNNNNPTFGLKAENDKLFNTKTSSAISDKTDMRKSVNESFTMTLAEENLCINSENVKKKSMVSTTQVLQDQKSPPMSQEKHRKKTEQLRKSLRRLKAHQIFRGDGSISLDPYKSEREDDDLYMCYQLPTFREDETLYLKAIQSSQLSNTFENTTMPNGISNATNEIRVRNHHSKPNQTCTDSSICLKRPTISQILESIERTYHCSNQNHNLYNTFSLTSLKDAPQNFTRKKSETVNELNIDQTNENCSVNQSINIVAKTEKSLNTSIITPHQELYLFRINKVISPANRLLSTRGNIWLPNFVNSNLLNKTLPNMPRYNESDITQENKSIPYDKEDVTLEADELMLSLSSTLNLNSSNDSPDPICCSTPLFQEDKSRNSNTSALEQTFTGAKVSESFNESVSSISSTDFIDLKQLDGWEISMLRIFAINHIKNMIKKMDCLNNHVPSTCESPRALQAAKAPAIVSRYMTLSPPIISTDSYFRPIQKHKKDIRASFRRFFKKGNVSNKINDNGKHPISTSVSENLHHYTVSSHRKKLTKPSFDVFGLSLRDYVQLFGAEVIIPPPISICCMRAIESEHETQIGLFRKAGSRQRISKLREWINEQSTNFMCEKMTQHNITDRLEKERLLYDKFSAFRKHEFISLIDVGDVIKQFYRQLHDGPLFNATYGTLLVTLFKLCNLNPTVAIEKPQISTKDLVALILCTILPLDNQILLRAFLQTLNCISRGGQSRQTFCPHKITNERVSPSPLTIRKSTQKPSMSARGLAICLVPTLFDMDVFESPNHHASYNSNNENYTNAIKCNKISTHLSDTETKQTMHCENDCSQQSLESIPHQKHNNNNNTNPPKGVKKPKRGKTFYPNACTSLPLKRLVEHKNESQHTGITQENCLNDKRSILNSNLNSYCGTKGSHDQKLQNENNDSPYTLLHINDAIDCLTYMIENYSTLFRIPISILTRIREERNESLTHKQSSTDNIMIT